MSSVANGVMAPEMVKRVVVVGAGTMGLGIAQVFAQSGREVSLVDVDEAVLARVAERIRTNLALLVEMDMVDPGDAEVIQARIQGGTDLIAGAAGADFAVEAVVEDLAVKHEIFRVFEAQCEPHAILATNTSGLPITAIAAATTCPERVIGTHFVNPAHVLPLVEVIKGERTSDETVASTRALMMALGKKPVVVWKDVPGFVGNRIQTAMMRECFNIVEQGIATPEDVDTLVKNSFGFRLPVIGPFESFDMVGLDVVLAVAEYLLPDLSASLEPPELLKEKVAGGETGLKSGKGMYEWPPAKIEEMLRKRDRDLVRRVRDQERQTA
ncbi:MAG: 3-hydroxyacyl-CoA dehydrogenase family protein [Actinobacteria bacterium]|nr:3-hydroxyacyl-CoA dehydrogenase family protein [Actinomycetota bacterium]